MVLKNIQAGGKDRPFLFSYRAIKELVSANLETMPEMEQTELMAFLGFKYGAIKEGIALDFELSSIEEWLEDDFSLLSVITTTIDEMKVAQEKIQTPNRAQKRSQKKKP